MGVTGLWTVVAPTARPTSLATLNRKRLAVDASIWIYQFLKAVRDKEGNALRNSHVVGFFRRICKLLYFGIKPVFVFDGGAPTLKRETVRQRRRRREGRREDAVRTAGRLLAVQMERQAEEEARRAKEVQVQEEELPDDAELVYVDEIGMSEAQRTRERRAGFKRKDQYHLPDLDVRIEELGAPNDPRIMSQAELEEYARQFHSGEDINLYDFSKIDFESPFFLSLPAGDRYNILNAARLRSRLRMGYSKEQLDGMFPDRMAFSKFQIERVKERNELTQRLMRINGPEEDLDINQGGRIAGEKGKEYVLVRNEGVEGGWALGVVGNKQGSKRENAIDLEAEEELFEEEPKREDSEEDEEFEDVAVEGLNRLPQSWKRKRTREVDYDLSYEDAAEQIARKRQAVYQARRTAAQRPKPVPAPTVAATDAASGESLFVPQDQNGVIDEPDDDLFEDVDIEPHMDQEGDDDLARAIAMSLEQPSADNHDYQPRPELLMDEDEDEGLDIQAALAESRKANLSPKPKVSQALSKPTPKPNFEGPLPFESINLGQSLLGKKKAKKAEEALSGGFDRDLGDDAFRKERPAQPMPKWFDAAPRTNDMKPMRTDEEVNEDEDHTSLTGQNPTKRETLQRHPTKEVIDIEGDGNENGSQNEQIDISSDDEHEQEPLQDRPPERHEWEMPEDVQPEQTNAQEEMRRQAEEEAREERYRMAREIAEENELQPPPQPELKDMNSSMSMDQVAEEVQANPPDPTDKPSYNSASTDMDMQRPSIEERSDDEEIDWSASEDEAEQTKLSNNAQSGGDEQLETTNKVDELADQVDEDEEFEDVQMPRPALPYLRTQESTLSAVREARNGQYLLSDDEEDEQRTQGEGGATQAQLGPEPDYLSDSDEEILRQLAIENEEHARFASSLSASKTPAQAQRDYENELKQLRNQQKRDRRDADEVTQTMIQECQALLRLFGLPYITAPMEAEAQCAELVSLGLVDGIVTDDSDIFLFGGTRIYKNMFNAAKFVECYLASDLEKEYALDRRKLIRFAHLLGSDYTEGIPGIGPVSALEILTDFSTLEEFKDWCSKVQLGRPQDLEGQLTTPFRRKFRNAAQKRVFLPPQFPDLRVDHAYLKPEVDANPEEFQWGVPDLDKLRSFLMATIGWSQERTDEILVPVIRDMNQRETEGTQANLTRFFAGGVGLGGRQTKPGGGEGAAPRNRTGKESGRMKNAFQRLRGEAERKRKGEELGEEITENGPEPVEPKNSKVRTTAREGSETSNGANDAEDSKMADSGDDEAYEPASKKKKPKKKRPTRRD